MADFAQSNRLDAAHASRLAVVAAQPRTLAVIAIVGLSALGWLYLAIAASGQGDLFAAICRPTPGFPALGVLPLVAAMWVAMVFAMMLPSAAPMVLTYAEIAETAARKGMHVVAPLILVAGYTAVWLGFASVATAGQFALANIPAPSFAPGLLSGAAFIAAGAYQFSSLKHACLRLCRQPFQFFFANWQTTPRGVFGLGVSQGLYCLGCCWAAMLLMFALGAMNIVWMAALGALMTAEKLTRGLWLTRSLGVGFIALGIYFMVSAGAGIG